MVNIATVTRIGKRGEKKRHVERPETALVDYGSPQVKARRRRVT